MQQKVILGEIKCFNWFLNCVSLDFSLALWNRTVSYTVHYSRWWYDSSWSVYLLLHSAHSSQTGDSRPGCKMANATLQSFNVFLTERLTAAAVDIYGFVEKTIIDYQDEVYRAKLENQRLQRLLDLVYKPEIRLHRAGTGSANAAPDTRSPGQRYN